MPAERIEGNELTAALASRLVLAFHTLHERLAPDDRAAVDAPYLQTSCRRLPLCAPQSSVPRSPNFSDCLYAAVPPPPWTRPMPSDWHAWGRCG